jgi:hypothetical protein
MTSLPLAIILSEGATSRAVTSALPHAPVVPHHVRRERTRSAIADLLQRAAITVAPREWSPAR